ncbi:MAG: pyridoxamine 5'-phosphate oxidase family protein [Candidatus Nealsonbacteria bacterium]|nr:pyridoxamine 5'-phosphate oxidase family protein [Candidatus Nealsonbacteria bacterium]
MKLTEKQIDLLNRRKIVVLATSDLRLRSRAVFVEVNQAKDDQIIITDNLMVATRKNLLENNQIALLSFEKDYSYCLKILGAAKYYTEGDYFDLVKSLETNKKQSPKGAIVITIKEIIEFK